MWPNDGSGGTDQSRGRLLMVDRIEWQTDGWPAIGGGTPGTGFMRRPTGDPD